MYKSTRLAMSSTPLLASLFALSLAGLSGCGEPAESGDSLDRRTDELIVGTGPLELAPLALKGVLFWDRAAAKWTTVVKTDGYFTWPSPYDINPPHVHFTFAPEGEFTSQDVAKLASRDGYALEVYLNDAKLREASGGVEHDFYVTTGDGPNADFGCPAGVKCMIVSVPGARAMAATFRWDMKLSFWKTPVRAGGTPDKANIHGYVRGPSSSVNYFAAKVAPIFQHDNCSTCHQLGTKQKLADQHHGLLSVGDISETMTPRGTQLRCGGGCHNAVVWNAVPGKSFGENEWMVPKADMQIDWTGKTPSQICARVKQNLTSVAAMEKHFFDDARIAWAVHSGKLPNGTTKPKAPPGDYYDFVTLMTAWIEGGQNCP